MDAADITCSLFGLTELVSFRFECPGPHHDAVVSLVLGPSSGTGRGVELRARGVSGLTASGLGGGLTQLPSLRVRDISERQLDRIRYEVEELEFGALSFRCREIEIRSLDGGRPSPQ